MDEYRVFDEIIVDIDEDIQDIKIEQLEKSIVFFISDVYNLYQEIFEFVIIKINTELEDCVGIFYVSDSNSLVMGINYEEVLWRTNNNYSFDNFLDSLFFVILHEIGHGKHILEKCPTEISILDYYLHTRKETEEFCNQFPKEHHDKIHNMIPEEIYANRFAFRNLQYLRELYNFNGYYY